MNEPTSLEQAMFALANDLRPEGISKAAFATTDMGAGTIKRSDADRFIDLVVDESVLLKSVRVHRTDAPSGTISKLLVTGPVTRGASEGVEQTNTRKPSNSSVDFATKKTMSCLDVTGEAVEDNPEGEGGRTTILGAFTKQIGNDMEQLALEGDTAIAGVTDTEALLSTNDGYLKLLRSGTGAAQFDASADAPSLKLLMAMLRKMPTKYRRNKAALRWIMSENTALLLLEELANTGNANAFRSALGDAAVTNGGLQPIFGIMPLVVPLMPEDLTMDGTSGDTGTNIILTDPMNLIYVVQREIKVEWERKPRKDTDEATISMRTDFIIENAEAAVKANNVNVNGWVGRYGAV
jgi:HK97 family phage major capsid protein